MKKLLFLAIILINETSIAGAWLLKQKDSELIIQHEYKNLITYYKNKTNGENTPSKSFSFMLNDIFYQYGYNDKVTIGLQAKWLNYLGYEQLYNEKETPSYDFFEASEFTLDQDYRHQENSLAEIKFFAQTPLWKTAESIISLQPNISFYNNGLHQSIGISILYGTNFQIGTKTGFINLEAGIDRNNSTSTRFDATIGYSINSRNMIMLQSFNRKNSQFYNDEIMEESRSKDIRLSYAYKYNKSLSITSGYATNLSQRNNYITESIITGVSIKF